MIIQAFLRWVETARAGDRVRAANALGRAFVQSEMSQVDRHAAEMAMTMLLDDPSPKVRKALAEAISGSALIPRTIILPLACDQPDIAELVISRSPVLSDDDLVDLAARGTPQTRLLIARRPVVSKPLAAALCEIGGEPEVLALLENNAAHITRRSMKRISVRLGHFPAIRDRLLARSDLPSDARHALVEQVGAALAGFGLVRAAIGDSRVGRVTREACESATVGLAGAVHHGEIPELVEHLRAAGRLTPGFLLQSLCRGNIDFMAEALGSLSGVSDKRVRSILADGRIHAVRALFENAGLGRDVSALFAEALLLWRKESRSQDTGLSVTIPMQLLSRLRSGAFAFESTAAVTELVEKLAIAQHRQSARDYASQAARTYTDFISATAA